MRAIRIRRAVVLTTVGGLLLSGCFFPPHEDPEPDPEPTLVSIVVSPADATIAAGATQQFTALGTYSDGATDEIGDEVTWSSSSAGIPISNLSGTQGLATGTLGGTATITATEDGVSGSTTLTVTKELVSVAISPKTAALPNLGDTVPFTLTGTYSDGTTDDVTDQATFSIPAGTVTVAIDANGVATRVADVVTEIGVEPSVEVVGVTGQVGALSDTAEITSAPYPALKDPSVITPNPASIATVGGTVQLTLTAHYFGGAFGVATELATWSITSGSGASVSNAPGTKGLVTRTSATAGSVTVQAVFGDDVVTRTVDLPAIP
jgi:hypothetical protein